MSKTANQGIEALPSNHSFDVTVNRIVNLLRDKGVPLFALIDHSGEAEKAGMRMPPTKILIFGNPKAGTPVMLHSPSAAIDLPLKLLVSEDSWGTVWISYNSLKFLQLRHDLSDALLLNLSIVEAIAASAGE